MAFFCSTSQCAARLRKVNYTLGVLCTCCHYIVCYCHCDNSEKRFPRIQLVVVIDVVVVDLAIVIFVLFHALCAVSILQSEAEIEAEKAVKITMKQNENGCGKISVHSRNDVIYLGIGMNGENIELVYTVQINQ